MRDETHHPNPLISVVLAVKNGERFIAEALESVFAQTYRPDEILVIDGNSDDNTAGIARTFIGVRVIRQLGRGVADAYNLGVAQARGKFISFISHDDTWSPTKLEHQLRLMLNEESLQYVTGRVRFFLEPGYAVPYGFRKELLDGDHVGHIMETLLARKSLFDRVGCFDSSLTTAEDVDWFNRVRVLDVPTAVLPSIVVYKRVHDRNISLNVSENNANLLRVIRNGLSRKRRLSHVQTGV
jgi:glycosyltransferase involved in cell wall biosynthesis